MFLDAELLFSDSQAITATANSTNVVDLTSVSDIGKGEPLHIFVQVTETLDDSGDDSTIAITLVTDDNDALSSVATVRSLVTLAANTAAGTTYFFKIEPEALQAYQRYIALAYTVANGNLSAGKITAGIVRDIQTAPEFPASGFTIT